MERRGPLWPKVVPILWREMGVGMNRMPCGGDAYRTDWNHLEPGCYLCHCVSAEAAYFDSFGDALLLVIMDPAFGKCLGPLGPSILARLKAGTWECVE